MINVMHNISVWKLRYFSYLRRYCAYVCMFFMTISLSSPSILSLFSYTTLQFLFIFYSYFHELII